VYPQVISLGIYSLTRRGWENPKPRFWHFEPWFPEVLEIFENTFLYVTAGSFGNGGGGRFLYPPLVQWERDAIRPSFLTFGRLRCFVEIRSWFVHLAGAETLVVARCFTDLSLPHPPKPPSQTPRPIAPFGRNYTEASSAIECFCSKIVVSQTDAHTDVVN
jgi:hypothetical protein